MAGKRYEDYVKKGRPWWKILLSIALSNVGMGFLCILYAVIGKGSSINDDITPNFYVVRSTKKFCCSAKRKI